MADPLPTLTPAERETYEERAAIREYDGGMGRGEAEAAALEDLDRLARLRDEADDIKLDERRLKGRYGRVAE